MNIKEVATHFKGVKWNDDNSFMALCPAHNDSKQSLKVSKGDHGGIVLYCHAGCMLDAILVAAGLTKQDIAPEKPTYTGFDYKNIVARYDYGNGTRKLRDANKNFTWQHLDENGEWIKRRGDAPHVLYHAGPDRDTVYITEGEKDCDNVGHQLGLCAVSSENGAGKGSKKWYSEYNAELAGRTVICLPDNDDVGRDFMNEIAGKILDTAESVKVIDLRKVYPELPEHGDISDVIKQLGKEQTLKKLSEIERTTPKYKRGASVPRPDADTFYRTDENGKHPKFAFDIMAEYLIKALNVCKINDAVHIYDNGIYRPGESILHGHMLQLVPTLSDALRREVYRYIKVSLETPTREVSPPHLIPFKSNIYDIDADRFIDYSPEYVFLNRFPYDYRPDAPDAPLVLDTIRAIADGDSAVIDLIYETFGNCFYLLNQYRGTVFFYGQNGNNGKSTLLNMLIQMVGRQNCSYLTIQDMAERFRLSEVYGKAANICDDNGDGLVADSSVFKRVSTGGMVTAEKKGQDPVTFEPFAKCFFALNSLPPVSDKSKAFFSRVLLIPLNADFSKVGRDTRLKDRKWTEDEMRCLVRLSIEGLKRLRDNGDFSRPDCVNRALEEYEKENNPALAYLEEHEQDIIGKETETAYRNFCEWCRNNGYARPFSKKKFSREIGAKRNILTISRYLPAFSCNVRVYEYAGGA